MFQEPFKWADSEVASAAALSNGHKGEKCALQKECLVHFIMLLLHHFCQQDLFENILFLSLSQLKTHRVTYQQKYCT